MFYLVKLKVAFKDTMFWSWIWALIHKQFGRRGFQKILTTYNLGQNCWGQIENLFFSEKSPLPQNQCCSQRLLAAKIGQIQFEIQEKLEFKKLIYFLNLLDFQLLSQQVLSRVVIWYPVHKVHFILHKKQLMLAFESDRFHALKRLGK